MTENITDDTRDRIVETLYKGRKIEAIKLYREATGQGLREAKDFIDALEVRLREESPEKFSTHAKAGCGAAVLFFIFSVTSIFSMCWS